MIPAQAVEAAARAHANHGGYTDWDDWEPEVKAEALDDMRAALEAAAPHLLEQAYEQGWEDGREGNRSKVWWQK